MSPRTRRLVWGALAAAATVAVALWGLYAAIQGVPSFYRSAVERDETLAVRSSDEFLQQAAATASDVRKPGRWEAVFTADQINGWLAVDMPRNHPGLLPETLLDPRIELSDGDVTLACRYAGAELNAVLTISCDIYLAGPNVLAIRIKGARAGLLPLPLGKIIDGISYTARALELPLEWRRTGGDPVALLSMAPLSGPGSAHRRIQLDTIELRDGELFVSGETEHVTPAAAHAAPRGERGQAAPEPVASAASTELQVADRRADAASGSPPADTPQPAAAGTTEPADQPAAAEAVERPILQR